MNYMNNKKDKPITILYKVIHSYILSRHSINIIGIVLQCFPEGVATALNCIVVVVVLFK